MFTEIKGPAQDCIRLVSNQTGFECRFPEHSLHAPSNFTASKLQGHWAKFLKVNNCGSLSVL